MFRRSILAVTVVAVLLAVAVGTVFATPSNGVSAETARGPLVDRPLAVNWHFAAGSKIKLQSQGPMEQAVQRIVAIPGATFGWHSHPGPTIVTVLSGTLSFYHAEDCMHRINYTAGQSFSNMPDEIHLARNEGSVDVVVYATYYVPVGTGALRIDQPSPGTGCPQ